MIYIAIAIAFILFALGDPIFVGLGFGATIGCLWFLGISPATVVGQLWSCLCSFVYIAVPMFIWMGHIMYHGGAAKSLVDFINSLVGHIRGGLLIACIVVAGIFAAMCGSAIASAAALGAIMFPMLVEHNYSRKLSSSVIAAGCTLAPIIPPSIWMILYGPLAGADIGKLFISGILPGIVVMIAFIFVAYFLARKEKYTTIPPVSWGIRGRSFVKAIPALLMIVLVLGGIYGGIFTPSEAASVGVIYCLLIGLFVYRGLNWRNILTGLKDTLYSTGGIMIMVATAVLLGFVLNQAGAPAFICKVILDAGFTPFAFLAVIIVVLLMWGMFFSSTAGLLILVPLLMPVVQSLGIDINQFGIIVVIGLCVGEVSPPFGVATFALSAITKEPSSSIFSGIWPFLATEAACLFLFAAVPQISLWLPSLM